MTDISNNIILINDNVEDYHIIIGQCMLENIIWYLRSYIFLSLMIYLLPEDIISYRLG